MARLGRGRPNTRRLAPAKVLSAGTVVGPKQYAMTGISGNPTALAQWKADGGTHAHVPAGWDTLQASAGAALTLTDLRTRLNNVTAAGLKPLLEIMLHYPPTWVQTAVEKYKDQSGNLWNQTSGGNADRNWVWTATGRGYVADLIAKVGAGVASGYGIDQVRIGGGFFGELHYPYYSGSPQWWGFSASMQSGTDLASDQVVCPLPGYIPFGTGHTAANDTTWTNWYINGLKNWLVWQIGQFKAAGFTQTLRVLHPGWGLRNEPMANTSWQTAACMGEDPGTMVAAYQADSQVQPWGTWADASGTGSTETTMSASAKLRQVATANGKANTLWCENVGGDNNAAMNGCFTESVTQGYTGFMWVDYGSLGTDPSYSNLVANMAAVGQGTIPSALSGTGTLTATVTPKLTLSSPLSGTGTLTATATPKLTLSTPLAGSGALSVATATAGQGTASVALSGTGSLTVATAPTRAIAASLTGTGAMSASYRVMLAVSLGGSGALAASPSPGARSTSVGLTGTGSLLAAVSVAGGTMQVTVWAATAPIFVGQGAGVARAFNSGDIVPDSHVAGLRVRFSDRIKARVVTVPR